MSTTSLNPTPTIAEVGLGSGATPPADADKFAQGGRLYRVVWRWHFYAGMIVAPVLIVVAATGALYIFKDELEAVLYPGVTYVEPAAERVSYEQQIIAARAAMPTPVKIGLVQVFADPRRATAIAMAGEKFQMGYVDPYRGRFLGGIEQGGFFDIVLRLHRQLFVGTTGRIVVELTTCWTIVLVATGMYLWWPRKWNQLWGVWLPRLRRKPYIVLRDLHSVGGIYTAIVAIVIALTGLIYTYAWGGGFQYAAQKTDAYDMFNKPMLCKSPPTAKNLPLDRFVEIGREKMPGKSLNVWFPRAPNGVYMVFGSSDYGPQVHEMLFIDRATGEILADRDISQAKPVYWFASWNYPLHVGSILGLPSKILWLAACLVLMTLPVTGVWMWWERRPAGRTGLPRRVDVRRPRWLVTTITATSILLPMLGLSVILLLVFDRLAMHLSKRARH
jgi:uncharacterized iron-regulated membrane protein